MKQSDLEHLPVMVDMGKVRHPFGEKGIALPKEIAEITIAENARIIPYDRTGEKTPEITKEPRAHDALVWGMFIRNPRMLIYSPINGKVKTAYLVSIDEITGYKRVSQ